MRDAVVVTGAHAGAITERYGDRFAGVRLRYVHNPRFADTNTVVSLDLALRSVEGEVLLLEGDVYFEPAVLRRLLDPPASASRRWTSTAAG